MTGISFPDVGVFISGCDPNDPNGGDLLWSPNLAVRTWRINSASRGRQYEQDQNRTGAADLDWRNVDEWLNRANASSPLLTYAHPMRRIRMMASYPPAGTGNLINTTAGMDPTFDSYTVGTLPSWLTAVGGTAPTVQSGGSHSGPNLVNYSIAATAAPQGVATTPLPFFPGKQYTASIWTSQGAANTQQIAVGGLTALDRFQRTGNLNGSTAETGQTWSFGGGVTGDYTTAAGANPPGNGSCSISNGTTNVNRMALLNVAAQDFDFRSLITIPAVATGNAIQVGLTGRWTSGSNNYQTFLVLNTNGTVDVYISKTVSGTGSNLSTVIGFTTYTAGSKFWMRFAGTGVNLQVKVWAAGTTEPTAWTVTTTDSALTAAGQVGFTSYLNPGVTNPTPVFTFGPLAITSYSTPGTTTTAVATYVRLQVTFTATQPTHTIALTTIGTSVSSSNSVDDIQVEPGGTANTFTQTGPLIRGLWGGHVMEFPVTWVQGTQGFEGSVNGLCSGAFAALAQIPIHTDYVTAVLRKTPLYYYPLWDQQGATQFAEISGNGGASLGVWTSPFGPTAALPAAGTPAAIAGDPSGSGVHFTGDLVTTTSSSQGSVLITDPRGKTPQNPIGIPATPGTPWGATMALWMMSTTTSYPAVGPDLAILKNSLPPGAADVPLVISLGAPAPNVAAAAIQSSTNGLLNSTGSIGTSDGKWHLLIATASQDPTNTVVSMYVDNALSGTSTIATGSYPLLATSAKTLELGANFGSIGFNSTYDGNLAHVAIWNRVLSAAEMTDLWTAGGLGSVGETSSARVTRYLGNYFTGPSTVDGTPLSTMGPPSAPESTPLLSALQRIQDTEAGNLFENRDGALQFDGREVRYLRTFPTVIFGDGPSEIPYTEAPVFGFGLTQVNNQALITRSGGIRAVALPDTTGSLATNYPRGFTLTVDCQTDNEAVDHANWIVATRQQPLQRVAKLRVNLAATPSVFPTLMNLEIGTRCTVNRRPKAANSGAGITMSQDYFVENIVHSGIDPEQGTWFVDLEMSPVPPQVWILGDATYSVLGSTTRLGF